MGFNLSMRSFLLVGCEDPRTFLFRVPTAILNTPRYRTIAQSRGSRARQPRRDVEVRYSTLCTYDNSLHADPNRIASHPRCGVRIRHLTIPASLRDRSPGSTGSKSSSDVAWIDFHDGSLPWYQIPSAAASNSRRRRRVAVRFISPGVAVRFISPGVAVRFISPGVAPGCRLRFRSSTIPILSGRPEPPSSPSHAFLTMNFWWKRRIDYRQDSSELFHPGMAHG
ncbi:hypothetical protein BZA05DRAFT_132337 [Tricharina praecox]|uniref:uncharacterized protein n=1 Tax=Tricharina praecox TaxID=43433 RepID=UPI00221E478E|nr:uncharacterized protein BZA05DRAFT_132337 [Tricharina praecox]KAI5846645.1 hypothetical protein BZA05DRAFT_132337 [Tricharina praecox]